jgi:uncharacterized protein Usg
MATHASKDFHKQLEGYGRTLAQIYYWHPDRPLIINPHFFVWNDYDVAPEFPVLMEFLRRWNMRNDGKVAFVRVDHQRLISQAEIRLIGSEYRLH